MWITNLVRVSIIGGLGGIAAGQDLLQDYRFHDFNLPNFHIAALGDVDGDGAPDFAVATGEGRGKVHVISPATQTTLLTFVPDAQVQILGTCLAAIGDADLDGIGDLAVGADDAVRVYSLGTGQVLFTVFGSAVDRFGYALSAAGDIDGDGRADVAVGAPQVRVWGGGDHWTIAVGGPGYVQILSGLNGSVLRTLTGPTNQTGFGGSISLAGNLDGDSVADLLVSHHILPWVPGSNLQVTGFAGASGAIVVQATVPYGGIVASIGDVTADGIDDFAVGSRGSPVTVFSGGGATLYTSAGYGTYDWFGASLARLDDLDGDGAPEILVGATQEAVYYPYGSGEIGPGYARVLSGRTGAELLTVVGDEPSQKFGAEVAGLGDLDGDGATEFLATAPKYADNSITVRIHSGRRGFSAPTRYCFGDFNSVWARAAIDLVGSPSLSANQFGMILGRAVPGQVAQLYCGTNPSARKFDVFHFPGMLCVSPPVQRLGPPRAIPAGGMLKQTVDLGPASPFTLGSTWYFQFAYASNPAHPNSSDALAVTFTP